jgi:hypothetical protein
VETLEILSEVCHADHPEIAMVASDRAETISMATTERWKIDPWDCTDGSPTNHELGDFEALNVTELKHQPSRMAEGAADARNPT